MSTICFLEPSTTKLLNFLVALELIVVVPQKTCNVWISRTLFFAGKLPGEKETAWQYYLLLGFPEY